MKSFENHKNCFKIKISKISNKSQTVFNIQKLYCDLRELKRLKQFDNNLICFGAQEPSRRLKFMQIQTRVFFNIFKKGLIANTEQFYLKAF